MDSDFDLPDSTDWLSTTLPAFEPLEAALRCEVCKEFLSSPVITSCHHTFCSICIRRCIAADGRCPSCKKTCSSDKLAPNIAVREVVMRFQEARPMALEMARADKDAEAEARNGKKRKLEDTDIEDGEPTRQTRSRQPRNTSRRDTKAEDPIEIEDSEDGDEEFLPEGMAKCPICNSSMKAEQVYNHLDVCSGPGGSQGRNTRSKTKATIPHALQRRQKEPSPPPTRLSQLNYAMVNEGKLRKKLQEIGIPNWGSKDLLKKRHIEWLNIYNSNCDAHESVRKTKRQLLKELEEWENTQGGRADSKESRIMKKDFDGDGHAKSHKTDFDDLIAKARQKRAAPKAEEAQLPQQNGAELPTQNESVADGTQNSMVQPPTKTATETASIVETHDPHQTTIQPYANNEPALTTIRDKVEQINETGSILPAISSQPQPNGHHDIEIQNPLGSPAQKVPMLASPEQPVKDMDRGVQ